MFYSRTNLDAQTKHSLKNTQRLDFTTYAEILEPMATDNINCTFQNAPVYEEIHPKNADPNNINIVKCEAYEAANTSNIDQQLSSVSHEYEVITTNDLKDAFGLTKCSAYGNSQNLD